MILNRRKVKALVLSMIRQHAPRPAAGEGLTVTRSGQFDIIGLSETNALKLAELAEPTIPASSSGALNMGPPGYTGTMMEPPLIPTLGPREL